MFAETACSNRSGKRLRVGVGFPLLDVKQDDWFSVLEASVHYLDVLPIFVGCIDQIAGHFTSEGGPPQRTHLLRNVENDVGVFFTLAG